MKDNRPNIRQLKTTTIYYRIVEEYKGGVRTLFHGTNRSRHLEPNKWLKSDQKPIKDGSHATVYTSGWHLLPTKEAPEAFKKAQFKTRLNKLKIIPVQVRGLIWPKIHSRADIWLAEWIKYKK